MGTLLHDQIHALFTTYLCRGYCVGIPEQRHLCLYLTRPLVRLIGSPDSSCHGMGHVPAFWEIARQLMRVTPGVLGTKELLASYIDACSCSETTKCLAHCYDPCHDEISWAMTKYPCLRSLEYYFHGCDKCKGSSESTTPALAWPAPALPPDPCPELESISWKQRLYSEVTSRILTLCWKFGQYLDRFNGY
jgi:hypothetical protein